MSPPHSPSAAAASNEDRFDPLEPALIGKEAENRHFGKPSGLMDQTECAVGGAVAIDFAHPGKPRAQPIPADFAAAGFTLAVGDCRADHADPTPEYAAIPQEMRAAANELGVDSLIDACEQDIRRSGGSSYRFLQNVYCQTNPREQALTPALSERFLGSEGARRSSPRRRIRRSIQVYVPTPRFPDYKNYIT